jgi:hypothetical protein
MLRAAALLLVFAPFATADDKDERRLKVLPARGQPAALTVTVRDAKGEVGALTKFDAPLKLPHAGPFAVWVTPKGGAPVRAADKLTAKPGETVELKFGDLFGTLEVFGDDFPRAEKVVVTDPRDPGPGEKGHVAIQTASDYRVDMLVPPGTYAVWVVPANGAKPQRVEDNVRVQAGRSTRVGG